MIIASDIHIRNVAAAALERLEAACRADADGLLVIAGDLTQHGRIREYEALADLLRDLIASGLRVVCCPGNHDLSYLAGYAPNTNRRRTGRYLDLIAALVHRQPDVLAFHDYDTVLRAGDDVFVSLRSVHRRGRLLLGNRVMRSQIRWARETLDEHGVTGTSHRVHFVTHYSLWSLPGDLHRNIHRRARLEHQILIPYNVRTYINGHNHRFDAGYRRTPRTKYRIFHIPAPGLVQRTLGKQSGFVRWEPARPDSAALVELGH
jgi:3',5'-cyclic AMP phosphodiesterase CpdA